jgi:glycosyltransferase involved in cell wall biosynthesis/GT2 family glycosyltransferase
MSVLFVASELSPFFPGGAGTVVAELLDRLIAAGVPAGALVVTAAAAPGQLPQTVDRIEPGAPDGETHSSFLAASRSAARAVADRLGGRNVDLVEFQDFDGLGFWALAHRADFGLQDIRLSVRFHGPVDLMFEAIGAVPPELHHVRVMERHAYLMADVVLVPSDAIRELVISRYGLEPGRVVVGEPPVPEIGRIDYHRREPPELVCLGRLGEVKGSHDFLAAVLPLVEECEDLRVRFIGADGWSVSAGKPMRAWLDEQIPDKSRDRFSFDPFIPPEELAAALATAWAIVIPSRFESFNLAAHEVRGMGLPVVLPDLPAFRDFFSAETGAAVYDGTVSGLRHELRRLLSEPGRLDALAAAPLRAYRDPLEPYLDDLPPIRHTRAQAGLATSAVAAVEAVVDENRPGRSPAVRLARVGLRILPQWAARLAVRFLPHGLKDRFRPVASWPQEASRRRAAARVQAIRADVAAGRHPDLEAPDITVVIPCFNQGEFLEDAILSVFEQSHDSWEIVVVDDGSTDPTTISYLDSLDYPRTRLVRQENRGLAAARNAGIGVGSGTYVVPLDADDQLAPEYLAILLEALAADEDAAFAQCWAELFGDVEAVWASRPYNPYQLLLSNSVIGCVLLRRSAFESVGGYDESMTRGNEDWDMWVRLLEAGWSQTTVRRPLFRYRKHGDSMSAGTEARFEEARREMARRHPGLYQRLRTLKRSWYPLVSIIVSDPDALVALAEQDLTDGEIVSIGPVAEEATRMAERRGWGIRVAFDRAEAVREARGKFVAEWDLIASAAPNLLESLANHLEGQPLTLAAAPVGFSTPVLWRRWPLLDPSALHSAVDEVSVEASGSGSAGTLRKGAFPTPGFFIEPDLAKWDLAVQRQDPEEAGYLPEWSQTS